MAEVGTVVEAMTSKVPVNVFESNDHSLTAIAFQAGYQGGGGGYGGGQGGYSGGGGYQSGGGYGGGGQGY